MPYTISPASLLSLTFSLGDLSTYVSNTLDPTIVSTQESFVKNTQLTFINYLDLLNSYYIKYWMSLENTNYQNFNPSSFGLPGSDVIYITNRLNALLQLVNTVYSSPLWVPFTLPNLNIGQPAVPTTDLISYFCNFLYEAPPPNLTIDNFVQQAQDAACAWQDVLNYWQTTSYNPATYNAVERMYYASQDTATTLVQLTQNSSVNNFPLDPCFVQLYMGLTDLPASSDTFLVADPTDVGLTRLWNSLVALPSLLKVSDILMDNPSEPICQSANAIRFYLLTYLEQINPLLASYVTPNTPTPPAMAVLYSGETLLDFASRTTGDYRNWQIIAQANNLIPPYIGVPSFTKPLPQGIAGPGDNLYLTLGPRGGPVSNYFTAFLGTDINLGPINQPLTIWQGEFNIINSYSNLQYALARQVLTQTGSFIYHTQYGSKLPGEIGNIQVAAEVQLLLAYFKQALLKDPRVASINKLGAVPLGQDQAALAAAITARGNQAPIPFGIVLIPTN